MWSRPMSGSPSRRPGLRWVVAGGVAFMVPRHLEPTPTWAASTTTTGPSVVYDTHALVLRASTSTRSTRSRRPSRSSTTSARTVSAPGVAGPGCRCRGWRPAAVADASPGPAGRIAGRGRARRDTRQVVLVESTDQAEVEAIVASMRSAPDGVAGRTRGGPVSRRAEAEVTAGDGGAGGRGAARRRAPYEVGRVVGADPRGRRTGGAGHPTVMLDGQRGTRRPARQTTGRSARPTGCTSTFSL